MSFVQTIATVKNFIGVNEELEIGMKSFEYNTEEYFFIMLSISELSKGPLPISLRDLRLPEILTLLFLIESR